MLQLPRSRPRRIALLALSVFAHYARLPFQFVFAAWAYWATQPELPAED